MVRLFCIAAFVYCLPTLAQCQQDTILLSPRVGTVIDAQEREYFGLFPDVNGFESAAVFRDASGFTIEAQYDSEAGSSGYRYVLAEKELKLLETWVEDFEPVRYAMRSPTDDVYIKRQYGKLLSKSIIRPYERPKPLSVSIELSGERYLDGMLLYCGSNMLILDPDPERFSFTDAVFIDTDSILDLAYEEETSLGLIPVMSGITIGALSALLVAHNYPMPHPCDNCMGIPEQEKFMATAATFVLVSAASGFLTYLIGNWTKTGIQYAHISESTHKPAIPEIFAEHQFFTRGLPPELKSRLSGN